MLDSILQLISSSAKLSLLVPLLTYNLLLKEKIALSLYQQKMALYLYQSTKRPSLFLAKRPTSP